jgi:predicted deacylase/pimeloyl-ACP methyl ester carboxylesterase/leucyl aminopeptidase (aminopeptidase T)
MLPHLIVLALLAGSPIADSYTDALVSPLTKHASPPGDSLSVIRVNGVEIHYHEGGSGDPIVFVHGGLVDLREWVRVANELRDTYRTIVYSRRYNYPNQNRLATTAHSSAVEAEDLAALIRELGLGPVHIAGISYGAYTALLTAIAHPELVRSLVIVEPPLLGWAPALPGGQVLHDDFMAMWNASGLAFARGDSVAALRAAIDWFVAPGAMDMIPPEFVAMLMGNIEEWRALTTSTDPFPNLTREALHGIEAPILMISGGRSYPVLQLIDDEVERNLRVGRRHVVPDGTHDICSNQTQTCAALVREFLSSPGATAAGIPATAQQPLQVGPLRAMPGQKASGHLRVPMPEGAAVEIPVSVVNGTAPGPVLALIAGTHGTEYTPILALQQLLVELDPAAIRGAVIMVHMANPIAFYTRRLAEGDPDDLNVSFPGDPEGTPSERLAWTLSREVVEQATHLIDMHAGDGNEHLDAYAYLIATGHGALDAATREMVLAYGMDRIVVDTQMHANEERTHYFTDSYALSLGKPAFLPEFGGLMTTSPEYVQRHVASVRSIMAHLGMSEGEVLVPSTPLFFDESRELRVEHTGLWHPLVTVRQVVDEGSLLGRVTDPFGGILQEIRAPYRGEVLTVVGTPPVNAGEAVVFLGRLPVPADLAITRGTLVDVEPTTDELGAIATSVARRSARVQPGEMVWIEGGADDVAFMERLAVAVGAEGGHPIVTIYTDEMIRRWYREVPEHFDTQRDEWLWQLYEKADVLIRLQTTNYGVYSSVDPERLAVRDSADAGASAPFRTRGLRAVWIGNGLHPSDWRSRMLGIDRAELEQIFVRGLTTDPAGLAASGERLGAILRGASTVRVQHPNGTDITVGTGRGNVVVTDGTTRLPPGPVGDGEQRNETWLPGGEVTMGLDSDRTDGRLVVERIFLDGQAIGPVTMTWSAGQMQAMESTADIATLWTYIEPGNPMSQRLTGLKFGTNPDVTDRRVQPLMGAGMFSFSMGSNRALGGDIDMPFMFFLTLAGATVHVDDRIVVQDGVLQP